MKHLMKMELDKQNRRWINPPEAVNRAHFKPLQLKCASDCGMTIPTTLCSNDANDIQAFLNAHAQDGVIHQPLLGDVSWPSGSGIFQKKVKCEYAIRVTCFGSILTATQFESQVLSEPEPYALSNQLTLSIRACMEQLGLHCAVFDFIKTQDGECVFMNLVAYPMLNHILDTRC